MRDLKELIIGLSVMIGLLIFIGQVQAFVNDCEAGEENCDHEGFQNLIKQAPPIKEAQEIKDACEKDDLSCLAKIAQASQG